MTEPIEILLSLALICFDAKCYPALVGKTTPKGSFELRVERRHEPYFGGDVLVFAENQTTLFAIHRAHNATRVKLLGGDKRTGITGGCVNVTDEVYKQLRACCSTARVVIK